MFNLTGPGIEPQSFRTDSYVLSTELFMNSSTAVKVATDAQAKAQAQAEMIARGPASCRDVSGPSGVYSIRTDPYFEQFPVSLT